MTNNQRIKRDLGSFKDPAGGVFYYGDKVCRWVSKDNSQFFIDLVKSAFFQDLMRSEHFVSTRPINLRNDSSIIEKYGIEKTFFEHETIDFLTFPYEWPSSMFIDAAFHTIDLQCMLLYKNLSLKDATPYNIQFRYSKPIFIDLCSIEHSSQNGVWIAYNQFCETFFYPLLMCRLRASTLKAIFSTYMNGLSLDETVRSLGFRPFLKYGMIVDYLIPAFITKLKHLNIMDVTKMNIPTSRILSNSEQIQVYTVGRLRKALKKMLLTKRNSYWTDYTQSCSYTDIDFEMKQRFIEDILEKYPIKRILDLGCNIGTLSILAAKTGCEVLAVDSDHDCVDYLYEISRENNYPILTLFMDIANPSPSLGWLNEERPSFLSRVDGQFDCVFALALVHHLMITNRIQLPQISRFFRQCTSRFLIVEYIGKSDMMFETLLKYRTENYDTFSMKQFENSMGILFSILRKEELINRQYKLDRCLYLMECH